MKRSRRTIFFLVTLVPGPMGGQADMPMTTALVQAQRALLDE